MQRPPLIATYSSATEGAQHDLPFTFRGACHERLKPATKDLWLRVSEAWSGLVWSTLPLCSSLRVLALLSHPVLGISSSKLSPAIFTPAVDAPAAENRRALQRINLYRFELELVMVI